MSGAPWRKARGVCASCAPPGEPHIMPSSSLSDLVSQGSGHGRVPGAQQRGAALPQVCVGLVSQALQSLRVTLWVAAQQSSRSSRPSLQAWIPRARSRSTALSLTRAAGPAAVSDGLQRHGATKSVRKALLCASSCVPFSFLLPQRQPHTGRYYNVREAKLAFIWSRMRCLDESSNPKVRRATTGRCGGSQP